MDDNGNASADALADDDIKTVAAQELANCPAMSFGFVC